MPSAQSAAPEAERPKSESPASASPESTPENGKGDSSVVMDCNIKELYYDDVKAVRDTKVPIQKNAVTAFIGQIGRASCRERV